MRNNTVGHLRTLVVLIGLLPGCTSKIPTNTYEGYGVGGNGSVAVCRSYLSTQSAISQWEQLAPSGSVPQVRYGAASAYDTAHDTLIVFGGTDKSSSYNDVRLLTHASGSTGTPTWSTLPVTGTPPPVRSFALAAYNATNDAFFIFGGVDGNNKIVADLWKLTNVTSTAAGGGTWTLLAISGTAPNPLRTQMSGVYDEARDTLVFFGGINCTTTSCVEYNDTYAIVGLLGQPTWSRVNATGGAPPGRYLHSSVYDSAHERMIVFGGNDTTNPNGDATANLDDVWILSNLSSSTGTWQPASVSNATSGPALMGQSAVYDAQNGRMIVFGGTNTSNTVTSATWVLADLDSSAQRWFVYDTGLPAPRSRTWHSAALAGSGINRMVVFGGHEGGTNYANDTWVLHNANGLPTSPVAKITVTSTSTTVCATYAVQLTATAADSAGNELPGVVITWKSSDTAVASIDPNGLVTATGTGTVVLTATDEAGSISGSIEITVTAAPTSTSSGTGGASGTTDCTCYCGRPANQVCHSNSDCPADTSEPGTVVPGVCGCPVGC